LTFLIFNLTLILILPLFAADGTTFDPSSKLYTARQVGLGGASLGFSGDANNVFSNPAGLTNIKFPKLSTSSRTLLFGEVQYNLLTWAAPTDFGIIGFGYSAVNSGGSYQTTLDPATNRIIIDASREAISYGSSVMAISYAKNIRENLAVGGNLKFFNQSFSGGLGSKASGTGIDVSCLFKQSENLTVGLNIQNALEGNLKWEGGSSDTIARRIKLGGSYQAKNYLVGLDYDLSSSYSLGVEYPLAKNIDLRAGLSPTGLAFGAGLTNNGFRFDYAYHQDSNIPGDLPHYFTFSYIGGRSEKTEYKLKNKIPYIRFLEPPDRLLTIEPSIHISAEATAGRVLEKKQTWSVIALSATQEVTEVIEPEPLTKVFFNGNELNQTGTISVSSRLGVGRNVMQIYGYADKEVAQETLLASAEIRVLRYKPFEDVKPDYWALRPIMLLETLRLVNGYPDNTFKPAKGISRAELVTLLVRTMSVKEADLIIPAGFKDVKTNNWASKYIEYGVEKGLVTGYPDGTFKPNKVLTRAEGITVMARYANLTAEAGPLPFTDLPEGYWANKYIFAADRIGLLKYIKGKDFEPSKPFTRAEACEVLYQTPAVQKLVDHYWETGETSFPEATSPATTEAN